MFEMKKVRIYSVLSLLIIFLLPALLFASGDDPIYDAPGFDAIRETFGASDFENIDPFTGGLTLNFVDMRLPGNGGLDLTVQRTFNSKNACKYWNDVSGIVTCVDYLGGDTWVGNGWTMHFGKVLDYGPGSTQPPIIEMPDGSIHESYHKPNSSDWITKDYWILQRFPVGTGNYYVLTLTDGKKITFNSYNSKTSPDSDALFEYYASKIEDTNGNQILIDYYDERDAGGGWLAEYKGAIKSVTDSTGRVTNF
jgi:hypothetical protein